MEKDDILQGLNKEQREAVTHKEGPLLIIAGAGTGKTTVITRRIAWLVAEGLAKPEEILALTFTDKAAKEMQERVDLLLPYGYTDTWISTFHAFGDRLLRENSLVAGLNPEFKVLTLPEAAVFFREHLFEFPLSYFRPLSDPTRFIQALITLFSRAKDEDISPEEYLKFAQDNLAQAKSKADPALQEEAEQQLEIAACYAKYQGLICREGLMDFGNQFYLALQLLRAHPAVLKNYQRQFKFILVDEFQDTNYAQYQLAKLLASGNQNITVTGDDDQCVYRFRGAAYSNLLNFIKDFPRAKKVSIVRNYRSSQQILDRAYGLIQQNNPERFEVKAGISKRLQAESRAGKEPAHLHFDAQSTEADEVAEMIRGKVAGKNFRFRDFAILVRSNSDAEPFLQSLNMQGIPWQFSGNQGLYSREEVRLCINFLRCAANPPDSMSLYYLASSEVYALDLSALALCSHYAKRRNLPLYSVLQRLNQIPDMDGLGRDFCDKAGKFLADLEKFLGLARRETTGRLLYAFLTGTGYLKELAREPDLEKETKIQNLAKFFDLVRNFELVSREDRAINFVNYLNLLIEAGDDPSTAEADLDSDAVNVLTIHKAKGLEFRAVFMVGLAQGRFPWPRRRQELEVPDGLIKETLPKGDFHLQEERRLFYVGMTRAKEELYFTSADDYGGKRLRRVSQFVFEALGREEEEQEKKKASAMEAIQRFAPRKESALPAAAAEEERQLKLSYYHLDDYLTCPLKYKYVHLLRVPILEHHTIIYGRAMHDAVQRFFQHKLAGKKMDLAGLLQAFRQGFDPQGFLGEGHQEGRLRAGEAALARFYRAEEERGSRPAFIEKEFSFIFEGVKIAGRFDRVDMEDGKAVIMDFKTSEIKAQKDADRRVKENKQLLLYALAWREISRELPARLELYFLESGLVGSRKVEEKDLAQIKEDIRAVSRGIRAKEFPAAPDYNACRYCACRQICQQATLGGKHLTCLRLSDKIH